MITFPSFFFLFFFFVPLSSFSPLVTLTGSKTIVSDGNVYECGLFQPDKLTSHWYLGIWLKEDPIRTSLWVANRDHPLTTPNGTLDIIDKELVLVDKDNERVWSANLSREVDNSGMVAQLQDNGNLVVKSSKHSEEGYSWQSFDTPTDTLLPQMRLGINPITKNHIVLKSWNSSRDPSSGHFSLGIEDESFAIFAIYLQHPYAENRYRSTLWNGYQFGDMPPVLKQLDETGSFVMTTYQSSKSRLWLTPYGDYEVYMWVKEETTWKLSWSTSQDSCFNLISNDGHCGSYGFCSKNMTPMCRCLQGFHPKNDPIEDGWSGGCARNTASKCEEDMFMILKNIKLPENPDNGVQAVVEGCEFLCRSECKCTAFALVKFQNGQNKDHMCITWTRELHDMQNYTVGGQNLYVRFATKEPENGKKESASFKPWMVVLIVVGLVLFIAFCYCFYKRKKRGATSTHGPTQTQMMMTEIAGEDQLFSLMDLSTIVEATDNFSNTTALGRGGFGIVYKGIFPNGKEVAVKRLSNNSSQGTCEFRNEVTTILNVLHKNLVRLLGCCSEGSERILVYEYLQNLSLDRYIFDEARSRLLNWTTRFRIINEIAQGLSYLHNFRDSPIIHRDLKPSNILLDTNMISKISDFGMAKILQSGQKEAETERLVGTYGYMSKEYAMDNIISEKLDVFSFGVMILEIITGRQNLKFCNSHPGDSLLDLAWRIWSEGNGLELIHSHLEDISLVEEELLRCVQISLCCVQDEAEDRPSMDLMVVMLKSSTTTIPQPKKPRYYYARFLGGQAASTSSLARETESSGVLPESGSYNDMITMPR